MGGINNFNEVDLIFFNNFSLSSLFYNLPIFPFWFAAIAGFFLLDIYVYIVAFFNSKHTYISSLNRNTVLLNSLNISSNKRSLKKIIKIIYIFFI